MLIFSNHLITKSTLFLLLINTLVPCYMTQSSSPVCPYPCLPPPTGAAISYPPPPQFPDSSNLYPPPPSLGVNPGDMSNYYPPPPPSTTPNNYLTPPSQPSNYMYPAPPPPNPILPWFPFYYKNPPPPPRSSAHSLARTGTIFGTSITVILLGFLLFHN